VSAVAAGCVGVGVGFALTAAAQLGGDLRPAVEPRPGAALRTDGAFRVSRHPVYAGLLLAATGTAVLRRRREPLAGLAALAAVLHVKTAEEERRLTARFSRTYLEYAARTPRLIGWPGRVEGERPVS
jgi:protein-S-isoprenylcysteine O-methyltransferase Ste14